MGVRESTALEQAREAYDARAWSRAAALYAQVTSPGEEDLERQAVATMLIGDMDAYYAVREQAHDRAVDDHDLVGAATHAFWIGMQRLMAGDVALGGGWLARCARLVEQDGTDSLPRVALRIATAVDLAASDGPVAAASVLEGVVADFRRLGSLDFATLTLHQQGLFLLAGGENSAGLGKLDEAMLEVASGRLSPIVTGIVYCGCVSGCWEVYELRRAQEWTEAMSRWCAEQPEIGNFAGECRVRRAELKRLRGAWDDARADLDGVTPADVDAWAAGIAAYLRGELDRLQLRFADAEDNFREAARLGCDPQPGLALLRLAAGSSEAAAAMVRRCLAESHQDGKRVEVLVAAVEILVAVADLDAADAAMNELAVLAQKCRTPVVRALADQARAAVVLAGGHPDLALEPARAALRTWIEVPSPYQGAQTRLIIAQACRELGDHEGADAEAALAVEALQALDADPGAAVQTVLSPRELEVLRLVATGATNRSIATTLVLSERTVDRHVSNIFGKLGVSSRAAATAYAFEQQLV